MAIRELRVSGYRSILDLDLKLQNCNVLTGPNGCGKSNLYQSLHLLARAAHGQLARAFAQEGGMPSALWAGPRSGTGREPVRIEFSISLDDFAYELACGLPIPDKSPFNLDPLVKEENVWAVARAGKRTILLDRKLSTVYARDAEGHKVRYPLEFSTSESALSQLREPHRYPELALFREEMLGWRFYHHFRTDPESPIRRPQVSVQTPSLSSDGFDLAAALETIGYVGDGNSLHEFFSRAFPDSKLEIEEASLGQKIVALKPRGLLRKLLAPELSDGTLRYLCLLAALLSPRAPSLIALNEPETSLHPDLLDPLAQLIAHASTRSQLWVTTHSRPLAQAISKHAQVEVLEMEIKNGATRIKNARAL